MTISVDRRSFMCFLGGIIPAHKLASFHNSIANWSGVTPDQSPSQATRTYACPPCGLDCDKLTFDKHGTCPRCGMKLIPVGGGEGGPPTVAVLLFNGASKGAGIVELSPEEKGKFTLTLRLSRAS
jgi:DNA-directed RNA polymerase subunit RPC12/RpoP